MKYIATFIVLYLTYIMLSGFELAELIVGAILSFVLSILLAKSVNYTIDKRTPIKLAIFLFVYIPIFVWELIKANFDIARRVLSPKIPLLPGFIKVETELEGDFGKLTLANSITLTPGTLTVDVIDGDLYIHCVEVPGETKEDKQSISKRFEDILRRVFK